MSYFNKQGIKKTAIETAIGNSITDEADKWFLNKFNLLSLSKQLLIFDNIIDAYEEVLVECIKEIKPFAMPFIGRIHIRIGKKIDISTRDSIANKYGYVTFKDIPKDIYPIAKAEHEDLVRSEYKKTKANWKGKRQLPKVEKQLKIGDGRVKQFLKPSAIQKIWEKKK